MINFEQVGKFSIKYDLWNRYLRFCHNNLYYKKVYIIGRENIPKKGDPVFIISNHQNGLMDALAILYMFDDNRQPVFIARGDIFKKDGIAKFLRFLKIMPTFRVRDGGIDDIRKNEDTFSIAAQVLNDGGTLSMFPEAGHQAGRFLSTFKKGYPRIAFKAEEISGYTLNLKILPINVHYSDYYNFRGKLLITIDKPFHFNELLETYKIEPNHAYLALNEKSREKVKNLMLDIEDAEHYKQYDMLRGMLREKKLQKQGKDVSYFPNHLPADKETVAGLDRLKQTDPSLFEKIMSETKEYSENLKTLNLRDWLIHKKVTFSSLLGKGLVLLFLFPFFLFGFINNIIPFQTGNLVKKKIKDRMLHSSVNFALNVIAVFPLFYIIILAVSWAISGSFLFALGYLAASFLTLFIFYAYKKRWIKFKALCRYYFLNKKQDKTLQRTQQLKEEIVKNCSSLI